MAFKNASNILRSCSLLDSYKLMLASAMITRPQYKALWFGLLRPFVRGNEVPFEYRCYGQPVKAVVRLSDLESDMQVIWELAANDTYSLDPEFAPELIVDGGGNIGFFTLRVAALAASKGKPFKLVIVEPVARNIETIQGNLARNGIQAEIKQACLGGTRRTMPFYVRGSIQSSFDSRDPYTSVIDVPVIFLQDAIGTSTAKRILIKLDIEGMEMEALREYVPTEQRAVYMVGELHDFAGESQLMEALFHEHGWVCEYMETFDNISQFRAASPAALPLIPSMAHLKVAQFNPAG